MSGPISDSYTGPVDEQPEPPRWAYLHLTNEEFEEMLVLWRKHVEEGNGDDLSMPTGNDTTLGNS